MTTKSIASATPGQKKQIVRLVEEIGEGTLRMLDLSKDDAQRLLGRGGEFKGELARVLGPIIERFAIAPSLVVVPDMSAVDLTAAIKRDLNLTYLNADYERWDYYRDVDGNPIRGRGLKFEVLVWKPELGQNETISSERARAYLRERGYIGHAGAFTQWRRQNPDLMGCLVTIPEDAACWRLASGDLFAPCSNFGGGNREVGQLWVGGGWGGGWSFVGFREVS